MAERIFDRTGADSHRLVSFRIGWGDTRGPGVQEPRCDFDQVALSGGITSSGPASPTSSRVSCEASLPGASTVSRDGSASALASVLP